MRGSGVAYRRGLTAGTGRETMPAPVAPAGVGAESTGGLRAHSHKCRKRLRHEGRAEYQCSSSFRKLRRPSSFPNSGLGTHSLETPFRPSNTPMTRTPLPLPRNRVSMMGVPKPEFGNEGNEGNEGIIPILVGRRFMLVPPTSVPGRRPASPPWRDGYPVFRTGIGRP